MVVGGGWWWFKMVSHTQTQGSNRTRMCCSLDAIQWRIEAILLVHHGYNKGYVCFSMSDRQLFSPSFPFLIYAQQSEGIVSPIPSPTRRTSVYPKVILLQTCIVNPLVLGIEVQPIRVQNRSSKSTPTQILSPLRSTCWPNSRGKNVVDNFVVWGATDFP